MVITQAFCDSYKGDLLAGRARLTSTTTGHRIALYTSSATLNATTTAYTETNEVTGTGYTQDGALLVIPASVPTVTGGEGLVDFNDTTFSTSTITARGALIYDGAATTPVVDASLIVLDFSSDKSSSAGDFTVSYPAFTAGNAIIRIV